MTYCITCSTFAISQGFAIIISGSQTRCLGVCENFFKTQGYWWPYTLTRNWYFLFPLILVTGQRRYLGNAFKETRHKEIIAVWCNVSWYIVSVISAHRFKRHIPSQCNIKILHRWKSILPVAFRRWKLSWVTSRRMGDQFLTLKPTTNPPTRERLTLVKVCQFSSWNTDTNYISTLLTGHYYPHFHSYCLITLRKLDSYRH